MDVEKNGDEPTAETKFAAIKSVGGSLFVYAALSTKQLCSPPLTPMLPRCLTRQLSKIIDSPGTDCQPIAAVFCKLLATQSHLQEVDRRPRI